MEIASLLLEHGANVDVQDKSGWTPLMFASMNGHAGIALLLVQNGASLDMQETTGFSIELADGTCIDHMEKSTGCSALMIANDHRDVVSILLDSGARVATVTAEQP